MSVTNEVLANNENYAANFKQGDLSSAAGQESGRGGLHGRADGRA